MIQRIRNNATTAAELFRDAELKEEQGDLRGAFRSLLAAAKRGDILSPLNLGNFYASGRGVRKNLQEAARWYKRAYRSGQSAGAINLAVDLQKQGNVRGAIAWLKRAVVMDDGEACVQLAQIYLKRRNGAKTAANLLRKAISLSPSNISDESKEHAKVLLRRIDKREAAQVSVQDPG